MLNVKCQADGMCRTSKIDWAESSFGGGQDRGLTEGKRVEVTVQQSKTRLRVLCEVVKRLVWRRN